MVKCQILVFSLSLLLAGSSLAQASETKRVVSTNSVKAQQRRANRQPQDTRQQLKPASSAAKGKVSAEQKVRRRARKRTKGASRPVRMARITHSPLVTVAEGRAISLHATVRDAHKARRVVVLYRTGGQADYQELRLQRKVDLGYAGTIPSEQIKPGHFEYTIEVENAKGERTPVFASRTKPQRVQVRHDRGVLIADALRRRLGGRTTQVKVSADWVRFGKSRLEEQGRTVADKYWRTEAEYRYRLLRRVQEFGMRVGVLRGSSPVQASDTSTENPTEVGLNYATPFVQLRLHELARFEGSATIAVTEVEFALGAGAELQLGDPLGTQLVLGASGVQGFGVRGHARLDVRASPRLMLSPDIEVTNQPNANRVGVRLSGQAAYRLTQEFGLALRAGYQARDAESGGVGLGTSLSYSF